MIVDRDGLHLPLHVGGPAGGDADPVPVLALHGFPQTWRCWDGVLPALHAAGRRTLALEQRGYCADARPDEVEAYALDHLVGDALAAIDAVGAEQVDLVGHDWGAVIAWTLAARHPERVRSLVAVSIPHPRAFASAVAHDPDQRQRSAYMVLFRQRDKAAHILLADDARRLKAMYEGSGLDDEGIALHAGPLSDPATLRGALAWYSALDTPALAGVGPVAVPTTLVWGDGDIASGPVAVQMCEQLVEAPYRLVVLEGVSHWVPDQRPAAVADAVLDPPT